MDGLQHALVERQLTAGDFFDIVQSSLVVDRLQVFSERFALDRDAFLDHKRGFLKRQRVALDAIALVSILDIESLSEIGSLLRAEGPEA